MCSDFVATTHPKFLTWISFFSEFSWKDTSLTHIFQVHVLYTLFQKKSTFNLSILPGTPGSLTLTYGLDDFVKSSWKWLEKNRIYNPRFTGIHSSPKERQLQKCCVSFGKECTVQDYNFWFLILSIYYFTKSFISSVIFWRTSFYELNLFLFLIRWQWLLLLLLLHGIVLLLSYWHFLADYPWCLKLPIYQKWKLSIMRPNDKEIRGYSLDWIWYLLINIERNWI